MPLYIAGYDAAGEIAQYSQDDLCRQQHADAVAQRPDRCAEHRRHAVRHRERRWQPVRDRRDLVLGRRRSRRTGTPTPTAAAPASRSRSAGSGEHQVSCNASTTPSDANGTHGESPTQTWSLKIGAPTVLGVGFAKYVGLKCHVVKKRGDDPGSLGHPPRGTARRSGSRPKAAPQDRARSPSAMPRPSASASSSGCRSDATGRSSRHHGKVVYRKKVEHKRVVVRRTGRPRPTEHVRHGHATTVSGWLGLTDGTALAGQPVQILTAPNNGLGQFAVAATATTAPDGTWTADLPAGPSRIVEASYGGAAGDRRRPPPGRSRSSCRPGSSSGASRRPAIAWGQSVTIKGKLLGGYLPAGGVNVRLRIGIGKDDKTTYGVEEHVAGNGASTPPTRSALGAAEIHRRYWFQIATLPAGNYPYSPSSSEPDLRQGRRPPSASPAQKASPPRLTVGAQRASRDRVAPESCLRDGLLPRVKSTVQTATQGSEADLTR